MSNYILLINNNNNNNNYNRIMKMYVHYLLSISDFASLLHCDQCINYHN